MRVFRRKEGDLPPVKSRNLNVRYVCKEHGDHVAYLDHQPGGRIIKRCFFCRRLDNYTRRITNPAQWKAITARYRAKHRVSLREKNREYWRLNVDAINMRRRASYAARKRAAK